MYMGFILSMVKAAGLVGGVTITIQRGFGFAGTATVQGELSASSNKCRRNNSPVLNLR